MNEYKTNQPPKMLAIGVGAVSETGQREQNQDRMSGFNSPFGAVYLVADGMGGHKGGAEASRMVAEAFSRHLMNAPASSPPQDALTLAVRLANLEILEKGRSGNAEFEGMGSTVVIALIQETSNGMELITAHVGDSRLYLRRNDNLTQLTKDHTQVQWLIDSNALDEASARNHPDASVLTRAMGHSTDLQVDISGPIPLLEGDILLLCSDGLSGFANAEDIDRTVAQNSDPTKCANKLVQLALASGSNDNITVQILRVGNAAQTRRRARKTDPGGQPIPSISFWATPRLLISLAIVLATGAAVYWFYVRPLLNPIKTNDPVISKLDDRIKIFQKAATELHNNANAGKNATDKDLTELDNLRDETNKPTELRDELHKLQKDLAQLSKNFSEVLTASNELEQDGSTASGQLPKPESTAPSQKTSDRAKKIEDLKHTLDGDEARLRDQQAKLAAAKEAQGKLKAREAQLAIRWKTAPAANKPTKRKPGTPEKEGTDNNESHN